MSDRTDTIAAIATGSGVGGVGIVRLSGERAIAIAESLLGVVLEDRRVRVGWARDSVGLRLDQVLAFAMYAPRSFTGENVAELQGHGGVQNLKALLSAALGRGARLAEPGEFTRRAVLHGKLDVARAEALLDVVQASTERALRLAQTNLDGRLGEVVAALERRLHGAIANVEARIDFPEEDMGPLDAMELDGEVEALANACRRLVDGFHCGRAATSGITAALVGRVNVGKSSLLNALVGQERAIVDAVPGTTRDYLEVRVTWDGIAVTLVDTAGMRETDDPVEQRGIALGEQRVAGADVVVVLNDDIDQWDDGARFGTRAIVVHTKCDKVGSPKRGLATSALSGEGLAQLRSTILTTAGVGDRETGDDAVLTTTRQYVAAQAAEQAILAARKTHLAGQPNEVVAVELRTAAQALAILRGVDIGEAVLDEVFARFCIGK